VALALAVHDLLAAGKLAQSPLVTPVAAVSCGLVNGQALLDLAYVEDSVADADVNVVQTLGGHLVEVQGTAEGAAFPRQQLDRLLDMASLGNSQLFATQQAALSRVLSPAELAALAAPPD
jgi:ribonuclease PH